MVSSRTLVSSPFSLWRTFISHGFCGRCAAAASTTAFFWDALLVQRLQNSSVRTTFCVRFIAQPRIARPFPVICWCALTPRRIAANSSPARNAHAGRNRCTRLKQHCCAHGSNCAAFPGLCIAAASRAPPLVAQTANAGYAQRRGITPKVALRLRVSRLTAADSTAAY